MKKVFLNYIYVLIYQTVRVLIPLIITPYTIKHITPAALGISDFAGSVLSWFILFGMAGISTYGSREIARIREDRNAVSSFFSSIFTLQICNMLMISTLYYLFLHIFVKHDMIIFKLTGLNMLAAMLDISWFFIGIEDFKKISIRNTLVRITGVFLIIMICKTPEDLPVFVVINACTELVGQIVMIFQLRKFIDVQFVSVRQAYRDHWAPMIKLFIPTLAISIYTRLDTTMLGLLYDKAHLALYIRSINFVQLFLTIITSLGTVMMPRIANQVYSNHEGEQTAKNTLQTIMKLVCMMSLPMCLGMMAVANGFVAWFIPETLEMGSMIMLAAPIIIFISLSNVTGVQFMIPAGKEAEYTESLLGGAGINFICNLFLIPRLGAYGAIISTLFAELSISLMQLKMISKDIQFDFTNRSYRNYIYGSLIMFFSVKGLTAVLPFHPVSTATEVFSGIIVYIGVLYILQDHLAADLFNTAIHSIKFLVKENNNNA